VINEPRRKIGDRTLEAVEAIAEEQGCSMFEVMQYASRYAALSRSAVALMNFTAVINELTALVGKMPLGELFDQVADRTGYRQMLIDGGEQEKDRLDNLNEFKSAMVEYEARAEEDVEPTLTGFLEENALVADVDRYDESADAVVMMTVHSAKGLEFPIVFLPGMEDGLFPGMQTITAGTDEMEEERRLAYVALTRAKKKIYIYHTKSRLLYGRTTYNPLSRFVSEIPSGLIEKFEEAPVRNPYSQQPVFKTYYSESQNKAPATARQTSPAGNYAVRKPTPTPTPAAAQGGKREVFAPGDRVRHMTFGEGEILSVKNMGADVLYEVMFDKVGTKKLMATYAKLRKI
jgi:DNA helicase-2/ATP-dependent DNA helicase PcrA